MPEQALGGISLGLGLGVEDKSACLFTRILLFICVDPSISVSISGDVGETRVFRGSSSHEQSGKTVHHTYTFYHLIRVFFLPHKMKIVGTRTMKLRSKERSVSYSCVIVDCVLT